MAIELLWDPSERACTLIRELPGLWVIADGGCIGSNPSPLGGTWAYRLLFQGAVDAEDSGHIRPRFGPVSNNVAELYALCKGIEAAERRHSGVPLWIASDSGVTLRRLCADRAKWTGVEGPLREWAQLIVCRANLRGAVLLKGHPTRAMLAADRCPAGRPVSLHNVWCDDACTGWAQFIQQEAAAK